MHYALCTVFCFFAALQIFLSYKSFRGGINYLNFFKQELAKPKSNYAPFCTIIAPCRGMDQGLEENLSALFRQNFPAYEIIFVVDSKTDEAFPVIEKVRGNFQRGDTETPRFSKVFFAGKAENESQKIHNLRKAVLHVSDESKIFVFVDSDAHPAANWLKHLIAPLQDKAVGAATGYRWFISKKFSLASEMRAAWNASIASALGTNTKSNFCWGGSTAIRRATFEKLNIREKWRGTLSDDFTVTRVMKKANLQIYFVPQCLTASVGNCSWRELFEFTTRQMKITRVYAANLARASLLGAFVFNLVWIWGILIIVSAKTDSLAFWFALISLFSVAAFSAGKAYLRWRAVRLVLSGCEKSLERQFLWQMILWIFTPALFFYNGCCALFSRRISWRGIRYEMKSDRVTLVAEKDFK